MRIAKYLWIAASFYLVIVGFFYIVVLSDAPAAGPERYQFILDHWTIYDYQWKSEFLIAAFLAVAAIILGHHTKNPGFSFIVVGEILVATAFPISIGITPNTSFELGSLIGKAAHQIVNFGMLISLTGFFLMHLRAKVLRRWLKNAALILSGLSMLSFAAGFVNLLEPEDTQIAMVLVMLLYIINGYLGFRIDEKNLVKL